jgi:hypothetical protein
LGIPLAFYSLVISPVLNYTVEHYGYGRHHSFIEYLSGYHHWIDFGVMWFVAALLLFNLVYLFFNSIPAFHINIKCNFLSTPKLLLAAFFLGLFTFLTRLVFPVGWVLSPVGFQLGHFPQYILLFIAGIIASKNNWLDQLNFKQGKALFYAVLINVLIILPASFILKLVLDFPGDYFTGGWNFVSLFYSLWEQITGVMIMVVLLSFAKFKWNNLSTFWGRLSGDAFGVYVFHPLVLVGLSLLVSSLTIDPVIKLVVVGPAAVVLSFLLISWLRKIKWISNII